MTTETITRAPVRLLITEISLCGWLGQAAPGDTIKYHRGALAQDCAPLLSCVPESDRAELFRISRRALSAFELGFVHLVQTRHGEDDYSYLMVARKRSAKKKASLTAFVQVAA
jgi:hypothetical protein